MARSTEQGDAAASDITQLRDNMPEDPLMFGFLIGGQLSAFSQCVDKPVDQGCPNVNFVNVELGRRFGVFRMDTAASVQHQRNAALLGDVAKKLKVKARTLPVLRADRDPNFIGAALCPLQRFGRAASDRLPTLIFAPEQANFRFQ